MTTEPDKTTAPAIEMRGLGKRYHVMQQQAMLLRSLLPFARPSKREHWALRDIDVEVGTGETVGVIGRNGAGKTTMLRLLAGVSQPTVGSLTVRGSIAPLIGVGVGFHNEMTGRENVHVNGMLLGLTKAEVEERFDDIAAFASLEGFLDTPVKFYSSGMFMRLGFSVAVHVHPEVLLVDEVLAVGDAGFQRRCFERMREMQESGATVVMVSHNLQAVRLLCPRVLVLRKGKVEFDGPAEKAIGMHHQMMEADSNAEGVPLHERRASGSVEVRDQHLVTIDGEPTSTADQDTPVVLRAELHFTEAVDRPNVLFAVHAPDGGLVYRAQSAAGVERVHEAGTTSVVEVTFQPRFGGGGSYHAQLIVTDADGAEVIGRSQPDTMFYVNPRLGVFGVTDLSARLRLDGEVIDDHEDLTMGSGGARASRTHEMPR